MDAYEKIIRRGRRGCRYIIGDTSDEGWRFCGARVAAEHKYQTLCFEHYLRCTVPLGKKRSIVELDAEAA